MWFKVKIIVSFKNNSLCIRFTLFQSSGVLNFGSLIWIDLQSFWIPRKYTQHFVSLFLENTTKLLKYFQRSQWTKRTSALLHLYIILIAEYCLFHEFKKIHLVLYSLCHNLNDMLMGLTLARKKCYNFKWLY